MPLPPLCPDPEPTEAEMQYYLRKQEGTAIESLPEPMRRGFARMAWQKDVSDRDPNAFWVPFLPESRKGYRDTDEWKRIRRAVLKGARYTCRVCGGKGRSVHHRDYRPRVLSGEDTLPLIPICDPCHKLVHGDVRRTGKFVEGAESERILGELIEAYEQKAACS